MVDTSGCRAFPPGPLRGGRPSRPSSRALSLSEGGLHLIPVCPVHTPSVETDLHDPPRTPCAGWLLKTCVHRNYQWVPLFCHSWRCLVCGPIKRAATIARLCHAYRTADLGTHKLKLVTLTYRKDVDRKFVLRSLQHLVQALRRKYGIFEYARFPERTKQGRIHLHLIALCPFIPQKVLSEAWRVASRGSYIVDIRTIHTMDQLARYVGKDLTKSLVAKVTWSRRFPNFEDADRPDPSHDDPEKFSWQYFDIPSALLASGGSRSLWTGEAVYPNGKCRCFRNPQPHQEGVDIPLREPHPVPNT